MYELMTAEEFAAELALFIARNKNKLNPYRFDGFSKCDIPDFIHVNQDELDRPREDREQLWEKLTNENDDVNVWGFEFVTFDNRFDDEGVIIYLNIYGDRNPLVEHVAWDGDVKTRLLRMIRQSRFDENLHRTVNTDAKYLVRWM